MVGIEAEGTLWFPITRGFLFLMFLPVLSWELRHPEPQTASSSEEDVHSISFSFSLVLSESGEEEQAGCRPQREPSATWG